MILLMTLFWISLSLIFYTYAGYPLLIFLLSKIAPKRDSYVEAFPQVTILIPAYNEEKFIPEKLENTLSLDYPREKLQILVAADGSSDKTPEIVKSYDSQDVELCFIPDRNGKMAAIVRAMQFSRGEIVIFSDANNMYDKQAIRELILPFSDSKVGATTGAKLIIEDGRELSSAEGLYWKYESVIKACESAIDSCVSSVGEILAIRRDAFIAPKEKIINDDHYIILDLMCRDYRVVYTPRARSFEYVSLTARDEVERRTRMNAGLYQTISMSGRLLPFHRPLLVWQIISHKYFRAFVPFAFVLLFLSNLFVLYLKDNFAASSFSWMLTFLYIQIAFYLMAAIGSLLKLNGLAGKLLYIPVFLVNSNLATLMGFYNFISNKQLHIWNRVRR